MILTSQNATDASVAGGKAAALSHLVAAGFDVPPFLVIPATAFNRGENGPIPADGLAEALPRTLIELGPGPFAVRSSGRSEDGTEHSHAGQFDTLLDIPTERVTEAAASVWASGFGDTVTTYRALTTGEDAEAPAVIVQRMVPARAAGVAFSADPLTGRRDRSVISAVEGLGDRLVSGEVDGEDWVVGTEGNATPPAEPRVLNQAEAQAVADLARRAEAYFGSPQDIEWAFDGDRLFLLQSRPITTALKPPANPDQAMIVFDNSNIVESYPGLVSPLTYSFAAYTYDRVYRAFVRLLGLTPARIAENAAIFANLLARIDGRVYYNLGNWYRALAMLPGFSVNRGFMESMMGVAEPLPKELVQTIVPGKVPWHRKAIDIARLIRVGIGLVSQTIRLPRTQRRFYARLDHALNSGLDLETASLTDLALEYRTIEKDLLDRWDAPLANDFLCMIGFGASRALLERWAGEDGLAFHNEIMIGQGDIVSAEPVQRIARMAAIVREKGLADAIRQQGAAGFGADPALQAEFDGYLDKFGDRCVAELKLESITLREDPGPLVAAVLAGAARGQTTVEHKGEPNIEALFPGRRLKARLAGWLCSWARARVRDRENLRFERTRIFGHARRVFLAMGRELAALGHLNVAEDIFFLTVPEVLGAIEGNGLTQNLSVLAKLRHDEMEAAERRPDPPERLIVRGAAIGVVPEAAGTAEPTPDGPERMGKGCSAGTVRATARVIHDPLTEALEPGEILVARNTDPGWIAVFSNASAIVVERGSLLSHSAIVARELGIPCVVALSDATRWIASGDTIEVDGATGRVRKVDA